MAILDNWFEFWTKVFHGISQHTRYISADLTGGFDSRVSLAALLHSDLDFSKIRINSRIEPHLRADYDIADSIANHYGFKLNQPLPESPSLNYSPDDVFNIDLYCQQTFRNMPSKYNSRKNINKIFYVKGHGGETIRNYWIQYGSWENFIISQKNSAKKYRSHSEIARSIQILLNLAADKICKKYDIRDPDSKYIAQYLYQNTRSRYHFGKSNVGSFFRNSILISPAFDPEIHTLKLETPGCADPNLLMATIFVRYEPDLLNFPFEGNRSIAPETLAYAKKISERFPRKLNPSGGGV